MRCQELNLGWPCARVHLLYYHPGPEYPKCDWLFQISPFLLYSHPSNEVRFKKIIKMNFSHPPTYFYSNLVCNSSHFFFIYSQLAKESKCLSLSVWFGSLDIFLQFSIKFEPDHGPPVWLRAPFLIALHNIGCFHAFWCGPLVWGENYGHWICIFWWSVILNTFSYTYWLSCVYFEKVSFHLLHHFSIGLFGICLLFSIRNALCVLDMISLLCNVWIFFSFTPHYFNLQSWDKWC